MLIIWILILTPLVLKVPAVKQFALYLLSFTNNSDYKIAYVEFWGTIIGSFIAIFGALWTQKRNDRKEAINRRKKYVSIVYFDLYLAYQDLIEIFRETKQKYRLKNISDEDSKDKFCEIAVTRRLYLSPTWIEDFSQMNDVLSQTEISHIYKCYGKLLDIDRAFQSGQIKKIKEIFVG